MIHELFFIFAKERELDAGMVQEALDALFRGEIRRVVTGEAFADLGGGAGRHVGPL